MQWDPWFRSLALLPFILFWIYNYQPADAVYYSAYEEVSEEELPTEYELIEKYLSPVDDFGDYSAFAVFQVDKNTARSLASRFSKHAPSDTPHGTPEEVAKYLSKNSALEVEAYHSWNSGGKELYGAVLSDSKTVIIFRSSW